MHAPRMAIPDTINNPPIIFSMLYFLLANRINITTIDNRIKFSKVNSLACNLSFIFILLAFYICWFSIRACSTCSSRSSCSMTWCFFCCSRSCWSSSFSWCNYCSCQFIKALKVSKRKIEATLFGYLSETKFKYWNLIEESWTFWTSSLNGGSLIRYLLLHKFNKKPILFLFSYKLVFPFFS